MRYYIKESLFSATKEVELTEENIIISKIISRHEKVKISTVDYQDIHSIELLAQYKYGGKFNYWNYSIKIKLAVQVIEISCTDKENAVERQRYKNFVLFLHKYCAKNERIIYLFYDDIEKYNKISSQYTYMIYTAIMWVLFLVASIFIYPDFIIYVFIAGLCAGSYFILPRSNRRIVYRHYKIQDIPMTALP